MSISFNKICTYFSFVCIPILFRESDKQIYQNGMETILYTYEKDTNMQINMYIITIDIYTKTRKKYNYLDEFLRRRSLCFIQEYTCMLCYIKGHLFILNDTNVFLKINF